jgi:ABC-type Fe3+/spermidine/putrescine transport system ATPase subunit
MAVHRGELFGLLGPSGCGKTTTLRLILGLETVDCGSVSFDARDITTLPAEIRGFGIVFQNYALFTELSVYENIAFGLRNRGKSPAEIRSRVEGLLAMVRLSTEIEARRPYELSAGEQQRVAIARALATEPELLLMDEPFANLDAGLRRQTGEEIRRIVKRLNVATVFVTHDQNEAFNLCDRMAVMRNGKVIQVGTPASIYQQPSEPWTAQFLGFQLLAARRVNTVSRSIGDFEIENGGWTLRVRESSSFCRTDSVILAVRPEDVSIVTERSNSGNSLPAIVRDVTFGGPTSRLTLGIGATMIEALVLRGCELSHGDRCGVDIAPDRPIVYPSIAA